MIRRRGRRKLYPWGLTGLGALLVVASSHGSLHGAPANPDFSGVWQLDAAASDPVDELLSVFGRSWVERKAAQSLSVIQTIAQRGSAIVIAIDTAVKDRTETLKLDGSATTIQGLDGSPLTAFTSWDQSGQTLLTRADLPGRQGPKGQLLIKRSLEDAGATMRQRLELHLEDGRVLAANRLFRKR